MANYENNVDYDTKVLTVENLKKHFVHGSGKNKLVIPAVDGLTFDVYKREVFGLVGESGCGKTTTGRTIMKLYNPTEGITRLNGEIVGAGYRQHVTEIKRIKKEAQEKILSFDKQKSDISVIVKNRDEELFLVNAELNKLKRAEAEEILDITKPIRDFKTLKYETKNNYEIEVEKVEYEYYIDSSKVLDSMTNTAQVEYEREISGAELNAKRKVDGLKESSALNKDIIAERIQKVTETLEDNKVRLDEKYKDLIIEHEKLIIPKEQGKSEIVKLNEKKKSLIAERKLSYKNDKIKIVKPDTSSIKEAINILKGKNKKIKDALKEKISGIKAESKKAVSLVPNNEAQGVNLEKLKESVLEINNWKNEAILEQKEMIHSLKTSNKSKEALNTALKMQMIFQDPISSLNPRMTVQEIIGEGPTIIGKLSKAEIKEKVGETLELVGLSKEYAARYPHEFSGGQRQRIGVARALIMNPDFIIADEPISALDVSIRAQVINLLSELRESLGLTMMFIAHDLSVVRFFCDRIAVMYNGKIVELASSEELFKNPMHPYTKSLLSSIPQPDPDYERNRKKIDYNPRLHEYRLDKPSMRELADKHYIYCNDKEFAEISELYNKNNNIKVVKKDDL